VSKLFCTCGRLVRISGEVPNPREWKLVPAEEVHGHAAWLTPERIVDEAPALIRCPDCRRLWIYWKGYDHEPTEYLPGDGG
jgi:hypothetical protein